MKKNIFLECVRVYYVRNQVFLQYPLANIGWPHKLNIWSTHAIILNGFSDNFFWLSRWGLNPNALNILQKNEGIDWNLKYSKMLHNIRLNVENFVTNPLGKRSPHPGFSNSIFRLKLCNRKKRFFVVLPRFSSKMSLIARW